VGDGPRGPSSLIASYRPELTDLVDRNSGALESQGWPMLRMTHGHQGAVVLPTYGCLRGRFCHQVACAAASEPSLTQWFV
jgi:hypothetical protein